MSSAPLTTGCTGTDQSLPQSPQVPPLDQPGPELWRFSSTRSLLPRPELSTPGKTASLSLVSVSPSGPSGSADGHLWTHRPHIFPPGHKLRCPSLLRSERTSEDRDRCWVRKVEFKWLHLCLREEEHCRE